MSCCINRGHSRINTEMVWNNNHKKWGAIMERHRIIPIWNVKYVVEGLLQLLSTTFAAGTGKRHCALPARGTKRRVTTARGRLDWLRVSASVGMSRTQPKQYEILSQTWCTTHGRTLFKAGYLIAGFRTPNLNFASGTQANASPGWAAGSPAESNTKTQYLHDAIFLFECALWTSLWKIWMATILFLRKKLTKKKNGD